MKKTVNINLGGFVFHIDEDAYDRLNDYTLALKKKFTNLDEQKEIIQDIEYRLAELFHLEKGKTQEVITIEMVNNAIITLGEPEEIENEEEPELETSKTSFTEKINSKKLFRDPDDKIIGGVLAGVSKYLGIQDVVWIRIITVLLVFVGVGFPVPVYFLLWLLVPVAKTTTDKLQMKGEPINLNNIEEQVKKNINADEIKNTSHKATSALSEILPTAIKIIVGLLVIVIGLQIVGVSFGLLGGGAVFSTLYAEYIALLFTSKTIYYLLLVSAFALIAIPLVFLLSIGISLISKKKVNWGLSIALSLFILIMAIFGIAYSFYSVVQNFKTYTEQTSYVALQNPTVNEIEFLFPYVKLKDNINMSFSIGNNNNEDDAFELNGIEVKAAEKKILINNINLDITTANSDTIFKLTKTAYSRGKDNAEAEQKIKNIHHELEVVNDKMISFSNIMQLQNETQWRNQGLNYTLYVPVGKKIHLGDNADKVIQDVTFADDYYKEDLSNNTWIMTSNGLKCLTCKAENEETEF